MNSVPVVLFLIAVIPVLSPAAAQTLERTKSWEVGDKLTYHYVRSGREMELIEEVVDANDRAITFRQLADGRTYEVVHSPSTLARIKGMCLTNGQQCEWDPGDVWADFPLSVGKRWSFTVTTNGETFVSSWTASRRVEAVEQVTTPAGTFEAYRIASRDRIESRAPSGDLRIGTGCLMEQHPRASGSRPC